MSTEVESTPMAAEVKVEEKENTVTEVKEETKTVENVTIDNKEETAKVETETEKQQDEIYTESKDEVLEEKVAEIIEEKDADEKSEQNEVPVAKLPEIEITGVVLVTGASGYIASHVIQQLQEQGHKVRGTVRSLENEAKVKHLKELCPDAEYSMDLVEANLTEPDGWESATKDCSYVIHVASPFPSENPKDENDLIKPAVDGTLNVLKACAAAKTVKRVVLTSSIAAILGDVTVREKTKKGVEKVYSEDDWPDAEKSPAYAKSKTLAEKAAWDFVKELPDDEKFELVVINPSFVMGPTLGNNTFTSMEVPKRLLERAMPALPRLSFPVIDVRDVAAAHIKGLTVPEAAGHRHIVANGNMWMKEIAQVLSKEFKPQGYNVPTKNCPYFALWVTGLFDKTVKMILPNVGKVTKLEPARMKNILGIEPRPFSVTLIDMCYSMIEKGLVRRSKKYRGPGKTADESENAKDEETNLEEDCKANGDVKGESDEKKEESETKAEDGKEQKPQDESETKAEDGKEQKPQDEQQKPETKESDGKEQKAVEEQSEASNDKGQDDTTEAKSDEPPKVEEAKQPETANEQPSNDTPAAPSTATDAE